MLWQVGARGRAHQDQARTQQTSRCPLAPCCSPSHKFVRTAGPFESCANKSPNSPKSRSKCEIRIWSKCRKFESIAARYTRVYVSFCRSYVSLAELFLSLTTFDQLLSPTVQAFGTSVYVPLCAPHYVHSMPRCTKAKDKVSVMPSQPMLHVCVPNPSVQLPLRVPMRMPLHGHRCECVWDGTGSRDRMGPVPADPTVGP
jgi:hypothetical protein